MSPTVRVGCPGSARALPSNTRGKCFRDFAAWRRDALEWLHGARFVEMQHGIELIGQPCMEVVAHPFGLRPVDNADRPLESRSAQALHGSATAQTKHETADAQLVKQRFIALRERRAHALAFRGRVPIRSRGHRAMMGGK